MLKIQQLCHLQEQKIRLLSFSFCLFSFGGVGLFFSFVLICFMGNRCPSHKNIRLGPSMFQIGIYFNIICLASSWVYRNMCRRVGSLISLQEYITVHMCANIHLCILYRGENRRSFAHWILCSVPIFSLVWVKCVDCNSWFGFPHKSLFFPFLLHLPLRCKLNFALYGSKSSVCVMLSVHWRKVYLLFSCSCTFFALSLHIGKSGIHLLTVPVLHLLLLWSVNHSLLPSPPKRHDKAVFCIGSVWSVDCFLFAVWVLCAIGRRTCCELSQEGQSCPAERSAGSSGVPLTLILA